jgi:hypothetical protein
MKSKCEFVLLTALVLCALSGPVRAADPGLPLPPTTEASDQKPGSILIFPFYSSSATALESEDTRIAITNTNTNNVSNGPVTVHVFLINGATGAQRDFFLCFLPNQTVAFRTSEYDPGIRGYLLAVAVDRFTGAPIKLNFLTGEADIKLASGHRASLKAMAVAANNLALVTNPGASFTLNFDGGMYNKLPRALVLDRFPSRADGNDTLLVVNRLSGLTLGSSQSPASIALFGILYDDASVPFSFSLGIGLQLLGSLTDSFPRTTPRLSQIVPSGRTGWLKIYHLSQPSALCGAVLNFNPNAATAARAFNGGHNLHALTLTSASMTMVVSAPSC